jgi:hypothetical protein
MWRQVKQNKDAIPSDARSAEQPWRSIFGRSQFAACGDFPSRAGILAQPLVHEIPNEPNYGLHCTRPAARKKYRTNPIWRQTKQSKDFWPSRGRSTERPDLGAAANPNARFYKTKPRTPICPEQRQYRTNPAPAGRAIEKQTPPESVRAVLQNKANSVLNPNKAKPRRPNEPIGLHVRTRLLLR